MNWDDVRIFLAVARAGQLLAAARTLGINHATVGRRISALEESLRTQLLIRKTSGCDLTPEGEVFLHAAERMEAEWAAAQANIGQVDASLAGTVRIGAPDGFGVSFLAPRLGALIARHPALKIQLVPVPRAFSVSQREADIAITLERPEQGRLVSSKLTDYSLGLYASRGYLEKNGVPDTVEALTSHRMIGYVEDLLFTASLNFTNEVMRGLEASFEISSATGQTEAVRSGAGIGILHTYIARQHPELQQVLPDVKIRRAYWIVFHESARNLARVRATAEFLQEIVNEERGIFG
ncbi:LysR family transcriptional regulator [Rhizobium sp. L1K21]|uniref:LysR family transcriptional regulator n=1 Tax=Rhizobium sp. L1K21 TaxID=2954933 RepID=UPI002092C7FA|nr:LysR family transcriptional regulator [Rhizobium sp. L1K21]MCO6187064.1 LysR family transcriptional regulator [Rhizobium sp. L1K21]